MKLLSRDRTICGGLFAAQRVRNRRVSKPNTVVIRRAGYGALGRLDRVRGVRLLRLTCRAADGPAQPEMSSRPEDSHLRALPDPYVNLSIHTAPDVRPFPWQSRQWAKSIGFARRSRSNQSRAPLVLRRNRLNLRRAQRMT